jgi:hypothetical protein
MDFEKLQSLLTGKLIPTQQREYSSVPGYTLQTESGGALAGAKRPLSSRAQRTEVYYPGLNDGAVYGRKRKRKKTKYKSDLEKYSHIFLEDPHVINKRKFDHFQKLDLEPELKRQKKAVSEYLADMKPAGFRKSQAERKVSFKPDVPEEKTAVSEPEKFEKVPDYPVNVQPDDPPVGISEDIDDTPQLVDEPEDLDYETDEEVEQMEPVKSKPDEPIAEPIDDAPMPIPDEPMHTTKEPITEPIDDAPMEATVLETDSTPPPVQKAMEVEAPREAALEATVLETDSTPPPVQEAMEVETPREAALEATVLETDSTPPPVQEAMEVEAPREAALEATVLETDSTPPPVQKAMEVEAPREEGQRLDDEQDEKNMAEAQRDAKLDALLEPKKKVPTRAFKTTYGKEGSLARKSRREQYRARGKRARDEKIQGFRTKTAEPMTEATPVVAAPKVKPLKRKPVAGLKHPKAKSKIAQNLFKRMTALGYGDTRVIDAPKKRAAVKARKIVARPSEPLTKPTDPPRQPMDIDKPPLSLRKPKQPKQPEGFKQPKLTGRSSSSSTPHTGKIENKWHYPLKASTSSSSYPVKKPKKQPKLHASSSSDYKPVTKTPSKKPKPSSPKAPRKKQRSPRRYSSRRGQDSGSSGRNDMKVAPSQQVSVNPSHQSGSGSGAAVGALIKKIDEMLKAQSGMKRKTQQNKGFAKIKKVYKQVRSQKLAELKKTHKEIKARELKKIKRMPVSQRPAMRTELKRKLKERQEKVKKSFPTTVKNPQQMDSLIKSLRVLKV